MQTWQLELRQCVRSLEQLESYLPGLSKDELRKVVGAMRLAITPHTLKLIDFSDPHDPILLMSVPSARELLISPEELVDPIGDEAKSPIPFLTHRYPDRVLIYATFFCSLFCRFCFRRFKTGEANPGPTQQDRERIIAYLHDHPEVDEVILTGGDPLTLLDEQLEEWLVALRSVPTIARIRFHTRVPVNLPSRITPELIALFKRYQEPSRPILFVTHFNHPREMALENIEAIARLTDAGFVVRNQGPLLKGVNDRAEVLEELFKRLTNLRVVPYYLHQLDLARGTNHFRVPIKRGMELMKQLQGTVTGIALPRYVLDLPDGKGKVPLTDSYVKKINDCTWEIESPFGERVTYVEPECA